MMKNKNVGIPVIFLSILFAILLLMSNVALAVGNLTLTVKAASSNVTIGDEVAFTISMSDAGSTDFSAFSFKINLPDGLVYKMGSGSILPGFLSSTGVAVSAFDEEPYLMASGFGYTPYNGDALEIAVFTCTATTGGQKTVNLSDIKLYNTSTKAIPNSVVTATIIVNPDVQSGEENPSQPKTEIKTETETETKTKTEAENPAAWKNPFLDVSSTDWFYGDIAWIQANRLMNGTGNNRFSPQIPMSRAMLVTVLYRLAGEPAETNNTTFSDVVKGVWYTDAVAWASVNGIVNGISATKFSPGDNITREQIATMLFRYAKFTDTDISAREDISRFIDANRVSDYAKDAISWAVALKIIAGRPGGVLDPKAAATRAEVAAILHRYSEASSSL
ncbi:MAG: S-layer homology domain-containing protein [Oscillospiraceae bacterium]|jgi:hypothetical protein|nr:S-layer homology domain-containing protein [Oscillospiraceae bacterium]